MTPLAPFSSGSVDTQRARLHDRLADCDAADLRNRLVTVIDTLNPGDVFTLDRILGMAGVAEGEPERAEAPGGAATRKPDEEPSGEWPHPPRRPVVDLMAALEASLAAAKGLTPTRHTPAELREMAVRDGQTPWPDDLADIPEYRDPQGDGPTPDPFGDNQPPTSR